MADVAGAVGGFIPDVSFSGSFGAITWIILFVLFMAVAVGVVLFVLHRLRFKYKIIIFQKVNGKFEATMKDRAMSVKHGKAGDTIFYLRKLRKYQPTPSFQTGRNTFWFFQREDDELINFSPGDFDEQSRELGAKFLDKEMRYARTSLQETFKERYNKPGFLQQYGALLINIAVIVVIMTFLWLIVDKLIELTGAVQSAVDTGNQVNQAIRDNLVALNNINSGSGLAPA